MNKMIVAAFKEMDRMTNYKAGSVIRKLTNTNTKRYWNRKLASEGDSWRDFPYEYLVQFLPQGSGFSLLDIGCALGDGCLLMKKHFPHSTISGADFSESGIKKARQRSEEINFILMDVTRDEPPDKYDYITIVHTLEHFNDPYPIVDKCLNFVNKAVIIQVPYVEHFSDPHLYSRGQHRYLFNEKTFSEYNNSVLSVTDDLNPAGYRYIVYQLLP